VEEADGATVSPKGPDLDPEGVDVERSSVSAPAPAYSVAGFAGGGCGM